MTDPHGKKRVDLDPTQLAAGSLAAVTSAVGASYLGVGGTLLGAGVGSVIATVGSAVYGHYLDRTRQQVRTVVLRLPHQTSVQTRADARDRGSATATAPPTAVVPGTSTQSAPFSDAAAAATPEPAPATAGAASRPVRPDSELPMWHGCARGGSRSREPRSPGSASPSAR